MSLLKSLFKKREKRVVIIGLDGVPHSLLKKLVDKGICPNIKNLLKNHNLYKMDASIPEISSVSWASFMTGKNPAKHGIYGFADLKPNSYSIYFPNYLSLKEKTIWDILGDEGKKTTVLNLPGTYPAREHNGILVSGFVAIDINKAIHPKDILELLKKHDYKIDVDTSKATDKEFFYKDLFATFNKREKVFLELWKEKCNLFIAVITDTDRLQHFEWDAIEDENHKNHSRAMEFYGKVDEFVGKILDKLQDSDELIMMSDHGFTSIEQEVYLNRILFENGFLKWEEEVPSNFSKIDKGTLAFALDPSRIYIHKKGKYPKGKVEEKDFDRIKEDLKDIFLNLNYNGENVIRSFFTKEEIYNGAYIDNAPDFVLISNYGFDLKGNIKSQDIFKRTHFSGMHTQDDAFLITKENFKEKKPHIENIAQIILSKLR